MFPALGQQVSAAYTAHLKLAGTSGSPLLATDFETDPVNPNAGWRWNTDGTLDIDTGDGYNEQGQNYEPNQWITARHMQTVRDVHIRFTHQGDDVASSVSPAVGTWGKVMGTVGASNAEIAHTISSNTTETCTYLVELSYDGGTTVHASGYYRIQVTRDSGV